MTSPRHVGSDEVGRELSVFAGQMNERPDFISLAGARAGASHQIQVTFDLVLILPHYHRQIKNEAVAAEFGGPSGAGDMAQPEWSAAQQNDRGELPRMTVKFVDCQVIFRGSYMRDAFQPAPQTCRVRNIVDVVEQTRSVQHVFASGVISDLQIDPRIRITLAQQLQGGSVHNEVAQPVIGKNENVLNSVRAKLTSRERADVDLQQRLQRRSQNLSH